MREASNGHLGRSQKLFGRIRAFVRDALSVREDSNAHSGRCQKSFGRIRDALSAYAGSLERSFVTIPKLIREDSGVRSRRSKNHSRGFGCSFGALRALMREASSGHSGGLQKLFGRILNCDLLRTFKIILDL